MTEPRATDVAINKLIGPLTDQLHYYYPNQAQLPNHLTKLRAWLIAPQIGCLLAALQLDSSRWILASLLIFAIQVITDPLDGYFARWYDHETPEGAALDPRVDKWTVWPNIIILAAWYYSYYREGSIWMLMSGITYFLAIIYFLMLEVESTDFYRRHPGAKSNNYGKLKFGLQVLVVMMGLIVVYFSPSNPPAVRLLANLSLLLLCAAIRASQDSSRLKRASIS